MTYKTFSFDTDADGIATLTIDLPDQSMNIWNEELIGEFEKAVDEFVGNDDIKGLVITSGKESGFLAGADLNMLSDVPEDATPKDIFDLNYRLQSAFRKMETGGLTAKELQKGATTKPVAAAINGLALGGGMEVVLACHYRVASDAKGVQFGQPEVLVGLIPGAGGNQRIMRLAGVQPAMTICSPASRRRLKSSRLCRSGWPIDADRR